MQKSIGYLLNLTFILGWGIFFLLQGRLAFCYLVDGFCYAKCDVSYPKFFYSLLIFLVFLWAFYKMAQPFFKTVSLKQKLKYLGISFVLAIVWMILLEVM